ncbi:helix-turn-helix domain-containing protein [Nakamurella flava]|uniref:Helix-turn-helix domain-containing protein n=1 Tax=Nakamurella flava TaxID=2576308 RepID=A0A4U6QCU3_9ACTN|nr:XRE family transcriptional regulator [Nakamurella flava]TKV57746.1 helix-turn-helix domain-containing protein [Nakamurella flava]
MTVEDLARDESGAEAVGTGSPAREIRREPSGPREGDLERSIAAQVRFYRSAAGLSVADMAERVGISKAMLSKIENAQTSCSLTTLARLAAGLEVPVTALFRGIDAEREAVFVPAGHGARIVRRGSRQGHLYELLGALRGPHKRMEAVLVTLTEASEVFPLFQHPGTELLFMLEGRMIYGHGETRYTLQPGDALQFDGEGPHGPEELSEVPVRFLSVTAYGDAPASP